MLAASAWAGVLAGAWGADGADAATLSGHVYIDVDGSGTYSESDEALAGIAVWWEPSASYVTTNETGAYVMEVSDAQPGVVWAQAPEWASPAPSYASLPIGFSELTVDLALAPLSSPDEVFTFVVASDTHLGKSELGLERAIDASDLSAALAQALALEPTPSFFTITGDLVQVGAPGQVAQVREVVDGLSIPFVPVAGNHDWKSPSTYRESFGPASYSFDAAGVHFVVLNDNATPANAVWLPFLEADLARTDPARTVVTFIHRPPEDDDLEILSAAGVDYLFTGHWHSNATFDYAGMRQLNTEPFLRGGIDSSPAGYRVVAVIEGELVTVHHNTVDAPVVSVTYPSVNDCLDEDATLQVIAAVHANAFEPLVELRVDDGPWNVMVPAGGWSFTYDLEVAGDRARELAVRATAAGVSVVRNQQVRRCVGEARGELADWPMLQGALSHRGFSETPLVPPLRTLWARAVGGPLHGGQPIVVGEQVIVALADFNDGSQGGVAAFDALTGEPLWRFDTGAAVRNAPAAAEGVVVVAGQDGVVHALELATGELLWQHDVATGVPRNESVLLQSPAVVDGVVYVGVLGRLVALDAASGELRWETQPMPQDYWLASNASPTVVGDTLISPFGRGGLDGVPAFDIATGLERWRLPPGDCSPGGACSVGAHAAAVVGDSYVYLSSADGQVYAVDALSGEVAWRTGLLDGASNWDYAIVGTPALAHGRLLVPTMYDRLHAVDAASGDLLWSVASGEGPLHTTHSRTATGAFVASPVVAADVVWAGGADGVLRALDVASGDERWRTDLGGPILMAPTPAGSVLYVGTFDGTLRAMAPIEPPSTEPEPPPPPELVSGIEPELPPDADPELVAAGGACACRAASRRSGARPGAPLLLVVVAMTRLRRRAGAVRSRGLRDAAA